MNNNGEKAMASEPRGSWRMDSALSSAIGNSTGDRRASQSIRKDILWKSAGLAALGFLSSLGWTTPAKASLLIDPASVSANDAVSGGAAVTELINNANLSASLGTQGSSEAYPGSFPTFNPNDQASGGYSYEARWNGSSLVVTIAFTLDQNYDLTGMYDYNFDEDNNGTYFNNRGMEYVTVLYSSNDATWSTLTPVTLPEAPTTTTYSGDNVSFGTTLPDVEYVDLVLTQSNSYGAAGGYFGLAADRFIGTVTVPEPMSASLFMVGAGLLMTRRCRRTRSDSSLRRVMPT